jgi:hypothetical protein
MIPLVYMIPFVYIIHILPFHVIIRMKEYTESENIQEKIKEFKNNNITTKTYWDIYKNLNNLTFNPITHLTQ